MTTSLGGLLADVSGNRDDEILKFALQGLERKAAGDGQAYQEIVEALDRLKDPQSPVGLINALARCTGSLRLKPHKALISSVLNRGWSGDEPLAAAAELFAVNAVSVNAPDMLGPCLSALVAQFSVHRAAPLPHQVASSAPAPSHEELQRAQRVHRAIRRVLETVPTGAMTFMELLSHSFPHRRKEVAVQTCFMTNAVAVLDYFPHLLKPILSLLIDKLIRIDVEIVPVEALDDDVPGEVFDMEEEEEAGGAASKEQQENALRVEKLDAMFMLMLSFLHTLFSSSSSSSAGGDAAFGVLLQIFDTDVLTTFRSKFTQFVIFYACGFKYHYVKEFLKELLTKAVEKEQSERGRVAAAAYLGSFLARFKGLHLSTLRTSLSLMARWVHDYILAHDHDVTFPDASVHTVFYSLVQSLLYALCFRLQALVEDVSKPSFVPLELALDRIVLSNLNPLKVVNQNVGQTFVRVASRLKVLDERVMTQLLKHNASFVLPGGQEWDEEHSFFPFDPFTLPASKPLIDATYQTWETRGADVSDEEDLSAPHSVKSSSIEDSIAMSLNSQLSLDENRDSPVWKPMSFSPGR